jgi:hypothetical protein
MENEDSVEAEFTIAVLWLPPHSNAALCSHAANPEHLLNAPGSFNIEDCGKFFCSCYRYILKPLDVVRA